MEGYWFLSEILPKQSIHYNTLQFGQKFPIKFLLPLQDRLNWWKKVEHDDHSRIIKMAEGYVF